MKLVIEIAFQPDWGRIENLRHGVETVLATGTFHDDDKSVIAMVSAELLENAFKYGDRGTSPVHFQLTIDGEAATVCVTNQQNADDTELVDQLLATVQWIQSFDNPLLAYIERMKTLYNAGIDEGGLGLVRIAYEGHCAIETEIDNDAGKTTVRAIFGMIGKRHEP